jgi:hypothetical protein
VADRSDLAQHEWRDPACGPSEMAEHQSGGDRIVERAMRDLRSELGIRGQPLQRVGSRRRQDDRGDLRGIEALGALGETGPLEETDIEADVVPDEARWSIPTGEGAEGGDRLIRRRCSNELVIMDAGQPDDGRRKRSLWIDEGLESFAQRDRSVGGEGETDRADLDDPLALGVVAGRLDVEGDELAVQSSPI